MDVLSVDQRQVAGRQMEYYLLTEMDAERARYGVKIQVEDGEETAILDVTVSRVNGLALIAQLARNTVTPMTLREIIDDWLIGGSA